VTIVCREVTSVIDVSISSSFLSANTQMTATAKNAGAVYEHLAAAAAEGLYLACSFPKIEMPQMTGAMAVAMSGHGEIKATLQTFFAPAPWASSASADGSTVVSQQAISTLCVYVPLTVSGSIGFNNVQIQTDDLLVSTVSSYASQGFRLAGCSISSSAVTTKYTTTGCTALAELFFQKIESSLPLSIVASQWAYKQSMSMGAMSMGAMNADVPDMLPYMNQMGAQGYQLAGFLMAPPKPPAMGVMSFTMEVPIWTMFELPAAMTPVKYKIVTFNYVINLMGAKLDGDPKGLIESYAQKGWLLKGSLNLPAAMKPGSLKPKLPLMLFFMSADALPYAEAVPVPNAEAVPVQSI